MGTDLTHKRSKSHRVMNLIRGGDSSSGTKDTSSESGSAITSEPSNMRTSTTSLNTQPTGDRLMPVTTNPLQVPQSPIQTTSRGIGEEQKKPPATGVATTGASIENSVRTFRVFEALRGKDAAAISKAIQESSPTPSNPNPIPGTTILHLAVQCAEPNVVDQVIRSAKDLDINATDKDGNAPLHLAAQLGRASVVNHLLEHPGINDTIVNRAGKAAIDLARTPEIFSQLQLARSLFMEKVIKEVHDAVLKNDYKNLEDMLVEPRVEAALDVNALELSTDQLTLATGGTLLHEAARKRDLQLCQILLLHGADPFRRDRKGKLPQDVTKDERTRAILKKSPAAAAAQRGIQEKAILGNPATQGAVGTGEHSKDAREMRGYLKKWTNYTTGYKLRWFVLEDGVLSYYKHQDDAGSACRGAINMRIARLQMDAQDKTRFEIHGKSSVKYHLKANHVVEAKRWFWSLNNAIQYSKDEAKEEEKRKGLTDPYKQNKIDATDHAEGLAAKRTSAALNVPSNTSYLSARSEGDTGSVHESVEASVLGDELARMPTNIGTVNIEGEEDADGDDASSHEIQNPEGKDAFNITAQSARLQLDLLSSVSQALRRTSTSKPDTLLADPEVTQALSTYETAVGSLSGLVSDLLKISRDRDAYWQYRLDRDADARKMWEESMAQIAYEHEDLKKSIAESEEKRKRTKKALKEALEGQTITSSILEEEPATTSNIKFSEAYVPIRPEARASARNLSVGGRASRGGRRKSVIQVYTDLSDSDSGEDEEFFDAVDAGQIEVVKAPITSRVTTPPVSAPQEKQDARTQKHQEIVPSFTGYEDGIRKRLKMDADDRPKISLWGILKSMIGKDMTKMTLPVSFNEPTSLLQRVAEDMEYADLLDIAADRTDSLERLVYVSAFAASEYASTIGRVAKPFNPLLGETYEYVRPDKGYRFIIEQVSHHPPIGAALAESARWDYWGESAVRSKFYGKSFDINPLGTWFLRLRPSDGSKAELYTWKKVTSSVIGIITGNPTVDNYGPMEIKNWTTGETCILDFKARGWKASSAYQVLGKVVDRDGITKWSIGGRWNDKIYARLTEGFEDEAVGDGKTSKGANQAILVWQANSRPTGIPFNLTPFVVTLNDANDKLKKRVPPTDTRLRPDQRAMEDGEYDFAATEKNRVEEKQRAARRDRENAGEVWKPKWFDKATDPITGESYWQSNGEYWKRREAGDWSACDDIF